MKITKIGHCCLHIEHNGASILTDPGMFTTGQNSLKDIDAVLITHEHADHIHMDSLKEITANNPQVVVITNKAVAELLKKEGIRFELLNNQDSKDISGVAIEAFEGLHADFYPGLPRVLNTGFFIGEKLFYPGDAFIEPHKPVGVLALPVAGPWMKTAEAIDYALAVKPRLTFPVHDAIYKMPAISYHWPKVVLQEKGIEFREMGEGDMLDC